MFSGLEPFSDDTKSPSSVEVEEENTSDACVSIADSDIDDNISADLEEDSAIREANAKLYELADVTVYDSYLLAFQYATRHSLTKTAFAELLQLISMHLPTSAPFPKCAQDKEIFSIFISTHHSCYSRVLLRLSPLSGDGICSTPDCHGVDKGQFISLPLAPQLKKMMEGMHIQLHYTVILYVCC